MSHLARPESRLFPAYAVTFLLVLISCSKKSDNTPSDTGIIQLQKVRIGDVSLLFDQTTSNVPGDRNIVLSFSTSLDTSDIYGKIVLKNDADEEVAVEIFFMDDRQTVVLDPVSDLAFNTSYTLEISSGLRGARGQSFPGFSLHFTTLNGEMIMESITLNGHSFPSTHPVTGISPRGAVIEAVFSEPLDPEDYRPEVNLSGAGQYTLSLSADSTRLILLTGTIPGRYTKLTFTLSSGLKAANGFTFGGFTGVFYSGIDSVYHFPQITDTELLTAIQRKTFAYFWDYAHPACGMTRERLGSGDVVTTGGSGFGVMALIVGVERGFISRDQALGRISKILDFLETCDRFHGVWPHWLNGSTGKTIPFSPADNGGDLVETSFMIQGLLTFRQYLRASVTKEKQLIDRINDLWESVEYDFYSRGQNALYWHWSPTSGWEINLKLQGYNETMICYVLGIGSPSHPIAPQSYLEGYMNNGSVLNGNEYYGYVLPMGPPYGGPLFFTHYSFLGLDPRNLKGPLIDYMEQNVHHTLINWAYCAADPKHYPGYTSTSWGLTASDGYSGYSAHSPTNDRGVITPTAAVSSLPYTPEQSMDAIHTFYYFLGDKLWGAYGFYDAYSPVHNWYAGSYLAIDQGPIILMIENYRSGLLWDLFMSSPEITSALDAMGFSY